MLATKGTYVPRGDEWVHEVKWDGVRALTEVTGGRVRMYSRNDNDITVAWPELSTPPLDGRDLVVDGEIIALNEYGLPDFRMLQDRMHLRNAQSVRRLSAANPATYMVFDLLRLDGEDLTGLPWEQRRARLEALGIDSSWQVPAVYDDGPMLFDATLQQGLEGVVSKRRSSKYFFDRRTDSWLKLAHRLNDSFVVGGWRPQEGTTGGNPAAVLVGEMTADGCCAAAGSAAGSGPRRAPCWPSCSPAATAPTARSTTRCRRSTRRAPTGSSRSSSSTSTATPPRRTSAFVSRPTAASAAT